MFPHPLTTNVGVEMSALTFLQQNKAYVSGRVYHKHDRVRVHVQDLISNCVCLRTLVTSRPHPLMS